VKQFERGGETVGVTLPSVAGSPGRVRLRPVALTIGMIVLFFGVVGLVLYFKPFADSPPSGKPELDVFAAGPVETFAPGTITYFQKEHVYLVHFSDGAFLALYDLSPATQTLVRETAPSKIECRVGLAQGDDVAGHLGPDIGARGFATTGFVDACTGAVWDAEGMHAGGPVDGRLDRFPVAVINDIVRIDLGDRRCLDDVAVPNPCIPTK